MRERDGQLCDATFWLTSEHGAAIYQRYLARWTEMRRKPALRQMGVDEIFLGKKQRFITVVSNLEKGRAAVVRQRAQEGDSGRVLLLPVEPIPARRGAVRTACVDMWAPFRQNIEEWLPQCRIVYDKFYIKQHVGAAVDEVHRAEFFRKGGLARELVKGKR